MEVIRLDEEPSWKDGAANPVVDSSSTASAIKWFCTQNGKAAWLRTK